MLGAVLGVAGFATAYALTDVPDPNELADAQVSTVYYADGTTPMGTFAARNRVNVSIGDVPVPVQRAVLAAEDRSFYENRGVSPTGIARALWNNLQGGSQQGGSTITQQYVKNYYLSADRSYKRKLDEFFIALKIDQQQSKDETLQDYLNTVYFGRDAWGIQAASQAYFGKNVQDLTVSEGALLAAVLKAPSSLDPRKDPEGAAERVDYVLDGMVSEGWLSAADRASAGLPETIEPSNDNEYAGPNGYLLATVRNELESATVGLTEEQIAAGGYKIVTTFDQKAQAAAVEAVQDQLPESRPEGLQVALSAIDPRTGGVTAMYGGADYLARNRNAATQDRAQAGSTFKPFTLVAALEQGISLRSTFSGASPQTIEGFPVRNFGNSSYGRINLLTATANSVNTVYARLNEEVTPQASRDTAIRAGYPSDTAGLEDNFSNVLGTASPHPIDVTQAYATFAAQGRFTQWHTIASIDDAQGARTYTASPPSEQRFDADVMADATYAMQQVVQSGSGAYARNLGRPAAGKTGTSSDNVSAWFAGFTPQLAASVAMYQIGADGSQQTIRLGSREVTGGSYPVRIWTTFMRAALQGQDVERFPSPSYVGRAQGAPATSSSTPSPSTSSPSASPSESASPSDSPSETSSDGPSETPGQSSGDQTPTPGQDGPARQTPGGQGGDQGEDGGQGGGGGQGAGPDGGQAAGPGGAGAGPAGGPAAGPA